MVNENNVDDNIREINSDEISDNNSDSASFVNKILEKVKNRFVRKGLVIVILLLVVIEEFINLIK